MRTLSCRFSLILLAAAFALLAGCGRPEDFRGDELAAGGVQGDGDAHDEHDAYDAYDAYDDHEETPRGPHGGRLLEDGDFTLELAIFETGVPPEFHAWASFAGAPVDPAALDLRVELARLGGRVDDRRAVRARGRHRDGDGGARGHRGSRLALRHDRSRAEPCAQRRCAFPG